MRFITILILFVLASINVFAQDVKILYPKSNDRIVPGESIKILISNPLSIPINLYYRIDNDDWLLLTEGFSGSEYDWVIPQSKAVNIFFKVQYFDIDQPFLYWHQEGAHLAELRSGLFTPSGNYILTSGADKYLKLWDFNKKSLFKELNLDGFGAKMNYSVPINDSLAVVALESKLILVNFSNPVPVVWVVNMETAIFGLDYTNISGGIIAVTSSDSYVHLFDIAGNFKKKYKSLKTDVIYSARFSRDGTILCFAGYDGNIECYDILTDDMLMNASGHDNKVIWSVDIHPDNNKILSGGVDGTARVWDIGSTTELTKYDSHKQHIRSVRCSPDGNLMISASLDGTLRQYNAANLNEYKSIIVNHGSPLLSVDYSPNSKYIVSSGRGNDFKVWRNFESSESLDSVRVALIRSFSVYIPHLTVNLNDEFNIPVLSDYNQSDLIFDKDEYSLNLSLEIPVLIVDVKGFPTKPKYKFDTINIPVIFNPLVDTIRSFDAITLLGPSNFGKLRILSLEGDDNLEIETRDGSVTITGECAGDFDRNIEISGNIPSMVASPNPADSFIDLNLNLIEDDNYILAISDLDSKLLLKNDPIYLKSGNHKITLNTSKFINGTYNLTVSGKRFIFTTLIIINR